MPKRWQASLCRVSLPRPRALQPVKPFLPTLGCFRSSNDFVARIGIMQAHLTPSSSAECLLVQGGLIVTTHVSFQFLLQRKKEGDGKTMMEQPKRHKALDDLASIVNATGYGAAFHKAISEYHGKPYNKKLNFMLICGGCASSFYFAVDKLLHSHLFKTASPPQVECPHCGHDGDHDYDGFGS
jgi:hypothetical protein